MLPGLRGNGQAEGSEDGKEDDEDKTTSLARQALYLIRSQLLQRWTGKRKGKLI